MTFSATLDRTLRVYRASFASMLGIAAATGLVQMPMLIALETRSGPDAPGGFWGTLGLIFALGVIITTLEYAAFAKVLLGVYQGRQVGFREAYAAAFSRLGTLLACACLMVLSTSLGLMLLLFPGIYIFLGFSLAFMVVMAEDLGAVAALKRSWALVNESRGRVLALLLVWGLLSTVLSYAVGAAMDLVGLGQSEVSKAVANQLAAIFVSPCYGLSLGLVYHHLREEKEGHDLLLEARRLAGAPAV
jgi:uncharacterized membrane protein YesL